MIAHLESSMDASTLNFLTNPIPWAQDFDLPLLRSLLNPTKFNKTLSKKECWQVLLAWLCRCWNLKVRRPSTGLFLQHVKPVTAPLLTRPESRVMDINSLGSHQQSSKEWSNLYAIRHKEPKHAHLLVAILSYGLRLETLHYCSITQPKVHMIICMCRCPMGLYWRNCAWLHLTLTYWMKCGREVCMVVLWRKLAGDTFWKRLYELWGKSGWSYLPKITINTHQQAHYYMQVVTLTYMQWGETFYSASVVNYGKNSRRFFGIARGKIHVYWREIKLIMCSDGVVPPSSSRAVEGWVQE